MVAHLASADLLANGLPKVLTGLQIISVPGQGRLMDLSLKDNLLICFISRNGSILIPSGSDSIQVGDTVMVVTTHTGFNDLRDILK